MCRKPHTYEAWYITPEGAVEGRFWYPGFTEWKTYDLDAAGTAATAGGITAFSRGPEHMEVLWIGSNGSVQGGYWYEGFTEWRRYSLAPAGSASLTGGIVALSRHHDHMEAWWIGSNGSIKRVIGMRALQIGSNTHSLIPETHP
jgi:hypothetical protein